MIWLDAEQPMKIRPSVKSKTDVNIVFIFSP
jgi:hypothetical protein